MVTLMNIDTQIIEEVIKHCNKWCLGNALACKGCSFFLPGIVEGSCYFKFLLPAHWDEQEIRRRMMEGEKLFPDWDHRGSHYEWYRMTLEIPGWDILKYPESCYCVTGAGGKVDTVEEVE